MKNLTDGKPIKLILLFAIPLFIGQIFQLFYSIVDTRIVGETLGETALAAVGATTTLSDLLVGFINGITTGSSIIVATAYGAKDEKKMKKAVAGAIVLGILFAVAISIFCLVFMNPILQLLRIDKTLLPQSKSYISIILAGLLATAMYNAFAAVLRAIGDSVTPLLFLIIASFLNVFLDYGFIVYLHAGVAGAAIATIISQAVSALLCLIYMLKKYPLLRLSRKDFVPDKGLYKQLLAIGTSMGFMSSFVNFGTVALQTSINTFGTTIIVAHTAARKLTTIFMLPFSVFGQTLATYCGQNLGAGKYKRIKKGMRDTLLVTFAWCTMVAVVAYTISPQLVHLLTATTDPEILQTAALYLKVNTPFYGVTAVICLVRNSMQGFGDSKTPIFSSSLEMLCKLLVAFVLAPAIGYWGIIICEPIAWFIMVIPLIVNTYRNPIFQKSS